MPEIFATLRAQAPGANGEIQLSDAIQTALRDEQVLAYQYLGTRFDCGSKLGYLKANVDFALRRDEVRDEFKEWLIERVCGARLAD